MRQPPENAQELLVRALREIDLAAGNTPDTENGRADLARRLGLARRDVAAAIQHLECVAIPSILETIEHYLDSIDHFIDLDDDATQIIHQCVPAPIKGDRLPSSLLQARQTTKLLIDEILTTINTGRLDGYWMQDGGYDYHSAHDYCQIDLSGGRRPWQSIRLTAAGAILMRERWPERIGHPYNRFNRLLEASLAFARATFDALRIESSIIAVQSTLHNAANLPLGVVTDFGTYFYDVKRRDIVLFNVPLHPLLRARDSFSDSVQISQLITAELRKQYSTEPINVTGIDK